jgi:hypothetical protein
MNEPHPHADAIYRVIPLDGGRFGVEVTIPESYPTVVSGLEGYEAANAWIAAQKARIAAAPSLRRKSFRLARRSG